MLTGELARAYITVAAHTQPLQQGMRQAVAVGQQQLGAIQQTVARATGAMMAGFTMVAAATAALAFSLKAAAESAIRYEDTWRKISALSAESSKEIKKMADEARATAADYGIMGDAAIDALEHVVDVGYEGANALKVFEAAIAGATGTWSDARGTAEALTGTMHLFNVEADKATDVVSVLMTAARLGRGTIEDFGDQAFGVATAQVAKLGVSLQEILAIVVPLSKGSLEFSGALRAVGSGMRKLITENKEMTAIFAYLDSTLDANINNIRDLIEHAGGLWEAFKLVADASDALGLSWEKVFGEGQRQAALLHMLLQDTGDVEEAYRQLAESGEIAAGMLAEAMESPAMAGKVLSAELKNIWIDLGSLFAETFATITSMVATAMRSFSNLLRENEKFREALARTILIGLEFGGVTVAIGMTMLAIKMLTSAFMIALLVMVTLYGMWRWNILNVQEGLKGLWDTFKSFWKWMDETFGTVGAILVLAFGWTLAKGIFLGLSAALLGAMATALGGVVTGAAAAGAVGTAAAIGAIKLGIILLLAITFHFKDDFQRIAENAFDDFLQWADDWAEKSSKWWSDTWRGWFGLLPGEAELASQALEQALSRWDPVVKSGLDNITKNWELFIRDWKAFGDEWLELGWGKWIGETLQDWAQAINQAAEAGEIHKALDALMDQHEVVFQGLAELGHEKGDEMAREYIDALVSLIEDPQWQNKTRQELLRIWEQEQDNVEAARKAAELQAEAYEQALNDVSLTLDGLTIDNETWLARTEATFQKGIEQFGLVIPASNISIGTGLAESLRSPIDSALSGMTFTLDIMPNLLDFNFKQGGGWLTRQEGGAVPGTGSGDIIPAMLEPGEFVVPRWMMRIDWLRKTIAGIWRGGQRMKAGGPAVPGRMYYGPGPTEEGADVLGIIRAAGRAVKDFIEPLVTGAPALKKFHEDMAAVNTVLLGFEEVFGDVEGRLAAGAAILGERVDEIFAPTRTSVEALADLDDATRTLARRFRDLRLDQIDDFIPKVNRTIEDLVLAMAGDPAAELARAREQQAMQEEAYGFELISGMMPVLGNSLQEANERVSRFSGVVNLTIGEMLDMSSGLGSLYGDINETIALFVRLNGATAELPAELEELRDTVAAATGAENDLRAETITRWELQIAQLDKVIAQEGDIEEALADLEGHIAGVISEYEGQMPALMEFLGLIQDASGRFTNLERAQSAFDLETVRAAAIVEFLARMVDQAADSVRSLTDAFFASSFELTTEFIQEFDKTLADASRPIQENIGQWWTAVTSLGAAVSAMYQVVNRLQEIGELDLADIILAQIQKAVSVFPGLEQETYLEEQQRRAAEEARRAAEEARRAWEEAVRKMYQDFRDSFTEPARKAMETGDWAGAAMTVREIAKQRDAIIAQAKALPQLEGETMDAAEVMGLIVGAQRELLSNISTMINVLRIAGEFEEARTLENLKDQIEALSEPLGGFKLLLEEILGVVATDFGQAWKEAVGALEDFVRGDIPTSAGQIVGENVSESISRTIQAVMEPTLKEAVRVTTMPERAYGKKPHELPRKWLPESRIQELAAEAPGLDWSDWSDLLEDNKESVNGVSAAMSTCTRATSLQAQASTSAAIQIEASSETMAEAFAQTIAMTEQELEVMSEFVSFFGEIGKRLEAQIEFWEMTAAVAIDPKVIAEAESNLERLNQELKEYEARMAGTTVHLMEWNEWLEKMGNWKTLMDPMVDVAVNTAHGFGDLLSSVGEILGPMGEWAYRTGKSLQAMDAERIREFVMALDPKDVEKALNQLAESVLGDYAQDALSLAVNVFSQNWLGVILDVASIMTRIAQDLQARFEEMIQTVEEAVQTLWDGAKTAFNWIVNAAQRIWNVVNRSLNWFVSNLREGIQQLISPFRTLAETVTDLITSTEQWTKIQQGLADIQRGFLSLLLGFLWPIAALLQELAGVFEDSTDRIHRGSLNVPTGWREERIRYAAARPGEPPMRRDAGGLPPWLLEIIEQFRGAIDEVLDSVRAFIDVVTEAWKALAPDVIEAFLAVIRSFVAVLEPLGEWISGTLLPDLQSFFQGFASWWESEVDPFLQKEFFPQLGMWLESLYNWLAGTLVPWLAGPFWNLLTGTVWQAFQAVIETLGQLGAALWSVVEEAFEPAVKLAAAVITSLVEDALQPLASWIEDILAPDLGAFLEELGSWWENEARPFLQGEFFPKLGEALSGLYNWLKNDFLEWLAGPFWEFITGDFWDTFQVVAETVGRFGSVLWSAVETLAVPALSLLSQTLTTVAEHALKPLADWMQNEMLPDLGRWLKQLGTWWEEEADPFLRDKFFPKLGEVLGELWSFIDKYILPILGKLWESLSGPIWDALSKPGGIFDRLIALVKKFFDVIDKNWDNIEALFLRWINDAIDGLDEWIGELDTSLKWLGFFTRMLEGLGKFIRQITGQEPIVQIGEGDGVAQYLQHGGITRKETLAMLHPNEAVIPLDRLSWYVPETYDANAGIRHQSKQPVEVYIQLDKRTIGRAVIDDLRSKNVIKTGNSTSPIPL